MTLANSIRALQTGRFSARSEMTNRPRPYSADEWLSMSTTSKINMGYARLDTIAVIGAKLMVMRKNRNGVAPQEAVVDDIQPSQKHPGDQVYTLVFDDGDLQRYYGQANWVWRGAATKPCVKHEAVSFGGKSGYCKYCDIDMVFDFTLGFIPKNTKV